MVIVTRGLSLAEEKYFHDTAKTPAVSGILAYDAVALVVNNHSQDTVMSMDEVRDLLEGNDKKKREAVMDGVSATSTVRYAMDSILKGHRGKKRSGCQVKPTGDFLCGGSCGCGWICRSELDWGSGGFAGTGFHEKVKVVAIKCERCTDKPFVYPFQANIVYGKYPMVRGLYYILKENFSGVGNNFVNFLVNERGQLIFKRAYLVPARMNFDVRNVEMQQ